MKAASPQIMLTVITVRMGPLIVSPIVLGKINVFHQPNVLPVLVCRFALAVLQMVHLMDVEGPLVRQIVLGNVREANALLRSQGKKDLIPH